MASGIQTEKSAGRSSKDAYHCSQKLVATLKEATTLAPEVTYQRQEVLGDSVLGFFLSMNLVGMNCSLEWDSDELARILSASANNRALRDAGLRFGVSRFLCGDRQPLDFPSTGQSDLVNSLLSPNRIPKGAVEDRVLSDVVASLLGAAYLDGIDNNHDPSGGRMVIAGPCIKNGYPFNQDKAWRRQLVQIGTALYCEHEVINRLETGWLKLMEDVFSQSIFDRQRLLLEKQTSKILLLCSLFNDSLSGLSEDESFRRADSSFTSASVSTLESDLSSTATPESGLLRIALLRDTLFMVGHSALHLAITIELFRMYPDADEVELSLMRSCATSDDVMAYIMVKNDLQQSLYHHNTRPEKRFASEIGAAEDLGRNVWNRRFGWILQGGKHEYARRCASLSFSMPQGLPRYSGLAGGRLYGHKSKLPISLTEDLVVSIKAIAGALVLSLGLEGMWQSLGPLFGELLLLRAHELKEEYRNTSSIVTRFVKIVDSTYKS
jgi:dsRNA-specific ribonuclease